MLFRKGGMETEQEGRKEEELTISRIIKYYI